MKHLTSLLLMVLLPLLTFSQSVVILRSLEMSPNSLALVQFNNVFGNWENRDVDDSFPYVVIQMNLEGDANAVSQAKLNLSLELGTLIHVTATDKNQQNKILFLVPKSARNIYILCGDGCTKQLLFSGALIENKVYTCTVQYNPESANNDGNNNAVLSQMEAMQKQMEAMQKQNEQMQQLLLNQQQNPAQNNNTFNRTKTTQYPGVSIENGVLMRVPTDFSGKFVIGDDINIIGGSAFMDCWNLTDVTIPDNVTTIGTWAFYNCKRLTSVTIPYGVTSIGEWTFTECSSLTNVTIPNSVTYIGKRAFQECKSLTSITIPNSVTRIEASAFQECTSLTSITIPNSVTSIGELAFCECTGLTSVTIPNSVTSIGGWAFVWCDNLTNVTISNSMKSIGKYAFRGCKKLTSVTFLNAKTWLANKKVFDQCPDIQTIYVPAGTKEYYQKMLPSKLKGKVIEQ